MYLWAFIYMVQPNKMFKKDAARGMITKKVSHKKVSMFLVDLFFHW